MDLELVVPVVGTPLHATLSLPEGPPRAVAVTLHGASDGSRDQPLLAHAAKVLPQIGVAVLRFDRRGTADSVEIPFADQLADLSHVVEVATSECGGVPLVLWGFSQGGWIATASAAALRPVALVLVGFSAVTPAEQMRFGTDDHLRRAGFGCDDRAALEVLRRKYEAFQRGDLERASLQAQLDEVADRPWFEFSWVPETAPDSPSWPDMDFDPAPSMATVPCPVLAFYGEQDEWVPVGASVARWHASLPEGQVTTMVLEGVRHHLFETESAGRQRPSNAYERQMVSWLAAVLDARADGQRS